MKEFEFENKLRSIAQRLDYPSTPDIAGQVVTRLRSSTRPRFASRKLAWSLTIVLVLFSSLMLIPPVRAAVIEFIQIGIVRIFRSPTEQPANVIGTSTAMPEIIAQLTATPGPESPSLLSLLDEIAGETDLASAQQIAAYPILLPTYPASLGQPDFVYVQDTEGAMTILVWTDSDQPERVLMSLHFIPTGHWAINKFEPIVIQETEVNGQYAVWTEGPYPLFLHNGDIEVLRLIEGHVLIWAEGDVTYRLETNLNLDEAIKIAESLEPIP